MSKKRNLPGSIYPRNGRWWWRYKPEDSDDYVAIPLRPKGARQATKDRDVAEAVALQMFLKNRQGMEDGGDFDGSVRSLIERYLIFAKAYYGDDGEKHVQYETALMLDYYAATLAEDFGPKDLRRVREKMIDSRLARKTINDRVARIKRIFKWAVGEELIPASTYQALSVVEGLRKNRELPRVDDLTQTVKAKETLRVRGVDEDVFRSTLPYMSNVVHAMTSLQWITGMRSTEICIMRPDAIDTSGNVWIYRPEKFKNQWREEVTEKVIYLGPKAQEVIELFMDREPMEYLFKPGEAVEYMRQLRFKNRKIPLHRGNSAGTNSKGTQRFKPCYDANSYRKAVKHAITAANKANENLPEWTPHQLRHSATTRIRKELGKEAAQAVLGHSDAEMTEHYSKDARASLAKNSVLKIG